MFLQNTSAFVGWYFPIGNFLIMSSTQCFHCGLVTDKNTPIQLDVLGETQDFCCYGCHAVCSAIIESGNEDYYELRETTAKSFKGEDVEALVSRLKLYDSDQIQKSFVHQEGEYKEAWLILEEIRCAACLWLNEQTLRKLPGVIDVQMDYTGQQTKVRWLDEEIKLSDILMAISQIGYVAHPFDPKHREALNKEQKQRSIQRIVFALVLGMMVMQTAVSSYFYGAANSEGEFPLWITFSRWGSLFITALLMVYSGQVFFRNAWRDLKNKTLGMDVPVAFGLLVAWFGSFYATVTKGDEVYYESIVMFILFMLIARYIELKARIEATALLDRTAKIIPAQANRLGEEGLESVAVIELQVGDKIQVAAGETVPVDAILQSMESLFDESLISGEGRPVHHSKGDLVMGGSINTDQLIVMEVVNSSSQSTLSRIQQLTQQSTQDKPHYVDFAEQIATKFVAGIIFIALLTGVYWYFVAPQEMVANIVAVLIVTCPCALALASPVALSLCAGGLAQLKLLVVRMSSIEELSHLDVIVFDKTGTLTTGKPSLQAVVVIGEQDPDYYLQVAASMEDHSLHPFAKAILVANQRSLLILEQLTSVPSKGLVAEIEGQEWWLGNEGLAGKYRLSTTQIQKIETYRESGASVLYLSNRLGVQALLVIDDPLRDGVKDFVESMRGTHELVVLSGDHQQSVDAIARQLQIKTALGGLLPADKLAWITDQQHAGKRVMMLGDGINDAPTMAAANVSLSFNDATELAQSHADWVLLRGDFKQLPRAFQLMKKTRQVIMQNLAWAVLYNVIAIPAAAMGFVSPWIAALGMSLSSFVVVLNSLRLKQDVPKV